MAISYTKKTFTDNASSGTPLTASDINKYETTINSLVSQVNALSKVDYITEQGTSGIWTYRKYNSGFAECWAFVKTSGLTSGWVSVGDKQTLWYNKYTCNLPWTAKTFISAQVSTDYTGYATVHDPKNEYGSNWLKQFTTLIVEEYAGFNGIDIDHNVQMYWCGKLK